MPGTGHLSINGSTYDLAADFESAADLEDFDRRLQLLLAGNVTTDAFAVRIDGARPSCTSPGLVSSLSPPTSNR